jgi:hypothetical protein
MGFVAAAEAAVLREFQPIRGRLFVLLGVVVPAFALLTGQDYHHAMLFFCHLRS